MIEGQQSSARTAHEPSRPQRLICSRRRSYIPATVPLSSNILDTFNQKGFPDGLQQFHHRPIQQNHKPWNTPGIDLGVSLMVCVFQGHHQNTLEHVKMPYREWLEHLCARRFHRQKQTIEIRETQHIKSSAAPS